MSARYAKSQPGSSPKPQNATAWMNIGARVIL